MYGVKKDRPEVEMEYKSHQGTLLLQGPCAQPKENWQADTPEDSHRAQKKLLPPTDHFRPVSGSSDVPKTQKRQAIVDTASYLPCHQRPPNGGSIN